MWLPELVKPGMSGNATMSPSRCMASCKLLILLFLHQGNGDNNTDYLIGLL